MADPCYCKDDQSDQSLPTFTLGDAVARRRKALELTQKQLADKIGCTREYINKIEHNKKKPSQQMLEKLSEALGIQLDTEHIFRARVIDDLLAGFQIYEAVVCPQSTAQKIVGRMQKMGIDAHGIYRAILRRYGLTAEGLLPVRRVEAICAGSAAVIFLEELILIAEALGTKPGKLIELAQRQQGAYFDWRRYLRAAIRGLDKAKQAKMEWDIPQNTRLAQLYRFSQTTRKAKPAEVRQALHAWLDTLGFSL